VVSDFQILEFLNMSHKIEQHNDYRHTNVLSIYIHKYYSKIKLPKYLPRFKRLQINKKSEIFVRRLNFRNICRDLKDFKLIKKVKYLSAGLTSV
jgi:hypothetical protein